MEDIAMLRKKVDEIDEHILFSLKLRVQVCQIIGKTKRDLGIPIRDMAREKEKCQYVMSKASELGLDPSDIQAIFREIIAFCRQNQVLIQ